MSRQSTPLWSPGAKALGVAVLVGTILGAASAPAEAAWGMLYLPRPKVARSTAPDQSWLLDIPEKRGVRSRGKVAVFVFKGDDVYQPVRAAVVRVLRRRGLNVTTTLRPVDSAAQYRELSGALNLAAYVQGEMKGEGARQTALIHLYSGVSGQRVASARFAGPTKKIVGDVKRTLWTRTGPTIMRACSSASRPRRIERAPLHIEAGTPDETTPVASQTEGL